MTSQEVRELAAKSAAELRRRGWTQNAFSRGDDRETCQVCAAGAVIAADGCDPTWDMTDDLSPTGRQLIMLLGNNSRLDDAAAEVFNWNDMTGRTVDDVLAAFDNIAAGQ